MNFISDYFARFDLIFVLKGRKPRKKASETEHKEEGDTERLPVAHKSSTPAHAVAKLNAEGYLLR